MLTRPIDHWINSKGYRISARNGLVITVERKNMVEMKTFKAFGFKYNTELESQFLLTKGQKIENEYCLDDDGSFIPGIIRG